MLLNYTLYFIVYTRLIFANIICKTYNILSSNNIIVLTSLPLFREMKHSFLLYQYDCWDDKMLNFTRSTQLFTVVFCVFFYNHIPMVTHLPALAAIPIVSSYSHVPRE